MLETFFEDLCSDVGLLAGWDRKGPRVAFRDQKSLPLMEEWRPLLVEGLLSAAVLVCVTSGAYFRKRFCGQEYYIFDQWRRQGLKKGQPPPVVLPVIWAPTPPGFFPDFMNQVQWGKGDMPDQYAKRGLRNLKILSAEDYRRCVLAFADAIFTASQEYPARVGELPKIAKSEDIPNPFPDVPYEEAVAEDGTWIPGPSVANFVYAAPAREQLPPPGRYGKKASQWRPFHPKYQHTIAEMARSVTKLQQPALKYREIPMDPDFQVELQAASDRKNLTIVVADAPTLPMVDLAAVKAFDEDPWDGTAVLIPSNEPEMWAKWMADEGILPATFKIRARGVGRPFKPVEEFTEFEPLLDVTLTNLRAAVTRVEAEKKPKTDDPPTQILGSSGTPS